jgi:hypothetical protein
MPHDEVREAYDDSVYDRLVDVNPTYDRDNVHHTRRSARGRVPM